ncbi:MAG TPA: Uma2 family endonuclease, partial [Gemmataceae bacterium]|nr:Uma2 family endonuclease [Gemmataceae bacterium]
IPLSSLPPGTIVYPDSDGKPMADNTKQLRWMVTLYGNFCAQFQAVAEVFVAADHLWYPVEGEPAVFCAPDVYVVFGRPKGDRGSYRQWEEGGVPLTVVFEILSPKNTPLEMIDKFDFYETHGVEEYYVYDPDANRLVVFVRRGEMLRRVRQADGFVSPRLGIRFVMTAPEMTVYGPDGRPFLTFEQLQEQHRTAEQRLARLGELSRKARRGLATPEELQELERLEEQAAPPSP